MDSETKSIVITITAISIGLTMFLTIFIDKYCEKQITLKLAEQGYYYSQRDDSVKKIGE